MFKSNSTPTIYDNLKTINISFLRKHGYLRADKNLSGLITWSVNGTNTACISIAVSTNNEIPYLELKYNHNDTPIHYKVQLVHTVSNIGKGKIWYFVCPHTGVRCRKLYLIGKYFYHRSALVHGMYEKQTQSHKMRRLCSSFHKIFELEQLYERVYSPNSKKEYAGKPTKQVLKLLKLKNSINKLPFRI